MRTLEMKRDDAAECLAAAIADLTHKSSTFDLDPNRNPLMLALHDYIAACVNLEISEHETRLHD